MRVEALGLLALVAAAGCARPDCASPPDAGPRGELEPAPGFSATVVLTGLFAPTQLQFDSTGRLFVLEGGPDGPKTLRVFTADFLPAGGVPIDTAGESTGLLVFGAGERVLIASRGRIDELRSVTGGGFGARSTWLEGLPAGVEHTNNGLALGADGFIYFGAGSSCDVCDEPNPLAATMLRVRSDQSQPTVEVFARGLRNSYDVAFTSAGTLLATDNGPECCDGKSAGCTKAGADRVVEVVAGASLGWPDGYRGRAALPAPLVPLPVHGGATGLAVVTGAGCGEVLYATLFGSELGAENGRRVVRAELLNGSASVAEVVLGPSGLDHPIDVTAGPDGALYILDYSGRVVRLSRSGPCP